MDHLAAEVTEDSCSVTTAATACLRRPQRQALEMCFTCMLGTLGPFGRRQDAFGVDLSLELVEHRLARVGGSSGSVFGVSPGFMGGDLSAQRALRGG